MTLPPTDGPQGRAGYGDPDYDERDDEWEDDSDDWEDDWDDDEEDYDDSGPSEEAQGA